MFSIHLKELLKNRQTSITRNVLYEVLLVKALSWRAVSESSEKFEPTTSRKSLDSVLEPLHWFQHGLVYRLHVVCLLGVATWTSRKQETTVACGRVCTTDPQTIFFRLWQLFEQLGLVISDQPWTFMERIFYALQLGLGHRLYKKNDGLKNIFL